MELKSYFAQDEEGNILGEATCYVYDRGTESLVADLFEANGLALDNPFSADQQGLIQFAAPNGLYDLRVKKGIRDYRLSVQCHDVNEALGWELTKLTSSIQSVGEALNGLEVPLWCFAHLAVGYVPGGDPATWDWAPAKSLKN